MYLFKMGLLTTKIIGLPMKAEVVVYPLIAVKMQFASGNEVTKKIQRAIDAIFTLINQNSRSTCSSRRLNSPE